MVELNQFWCRLDGRSTKFTRLKMLNELSPEDRLFAALVRSDRDGAMAILDTVDKSKFAITFTEFAKTTGFSYLVFDRLSHLDCAEFLKSPCYEATVADRLSKLSGIIAASRRMAEKQFADLLDVLRDEKENILWIKGMHLSRSVYPQGDFRYYGDLDAVVNPRVLLKVLDKLKAFGFKTFGGAEYSNQLGAGPSTNFEDLFLAPLPELIPTSALTLKKKGMPLLDIKAGPLDRGLQPVELDRFFQSAETFTVHKREYRAPCNIDHLMIILRNLEKDRFDNWKALLDIHFLSGKLNAKQADWITFVERCKKEGIQTGAWAGLSMCTNRFDTLIPNTVLDELKPALISLQPLLAFTVSSNFVWNSNSLPMLVLNALASHDRVRKLSALFRSAFPKTQFLNSYYNSSAQGTKAAPRLLLHWLVLILPAGAVRTSFGKKMWQFDTEEAKTQLAPK